MTQTSDTPGPPTPKADRMANEYMLAVGKRLRDVRTEIGLSLSAVETKSNGKWKAVVIGSYERGERAITMVRLAELSDFYDTPVAELLPENPATRHPRAEFPLVLDLQRLSELPEPLAGPLARYTAMIADQRSDDNRRVLSIRTSDLMSLAIIYNMAPTELAHQLIHYGVLPPDTVVD